MKYVFSPLIALAMAGFACSLLPSATPTEPPVVTEPPATVPPVVTELPATVPPVATEPPVTAPPAATNATCNELSLYLDPALASGYDCQTIPESTIEFDLFPQHTELALQGYPLAGKFFEPHISIYPVAGYIALLPEHDIPGRVAALQALIAGGTPGDDSLPFLPTFNAAQVFHAQYLVVPFVSGGGIRFLTEYAQYYAPVNNTDLFYTYQGLTVDGAYWISAILPINNPILPANAENPPGGVTWEEFSNNYDTYIADTISQLDSQPAASYVPSLAALDALVASITIAP